LSLRVRVVFEDDDLIGLVELLSVGARPRLAAPAPPLLGHYVRNGLVGRGIGLEPIDVPTLHPGRPFDLGAVEACTEQPASTEARALEPRRREEPTFQKPILEVTGAQVRIVEKGMPEIAAVEVQARKHASA
jgi:hypothetical protein